MYERLRQVCTSGVTVVSGHFDQEIRAILEDCPVTIIRNKNPARGMASSLVLGSKNVPEHTSFLVLLCDLYRVDVIHLKQLITASESFGIGCCSASPDGPLVPPSLFSHRFLKDIQSLSGDNGAKSIINKHSEDTNRVIIPETAYDIDTPDDLIKAQNWWKQNHAQN